MDPTNWLTGLFNPMTPGWDVGGSMGASAPQITPTMLYPFTSVGGGPVPEFPPGPQFGAPRTNEYGQVLPEVPPQDTEGNVIPSVSGGALPNVERTALGLGGGGGGNQGANANTFLAGLRGVQAPAPPVAQRVATPHQAAMARLPDRVNDMINLMSALGISPKDLPRFGR
jgi:hypothetical protein